MGLMESKYEYDQTYLDKEKKKTSTQFGISNLSPWSELYPWWVEKDDCHRLKSVSLFQCVLSLETYRIRYLYSQDQATQLCRILIGEQETRNPSGEEESVCLVPGGTLLFHLFHLWLDSISNYSIPWLSAKGSFVLRYGVPEWGRPDVPHPRQRALRPLQSNVSPLPFLPTSMNDFMPGPLLTWSQVSVADGWKDVSRH